MSAADEVLQLFEARGDAAYFGEDVSVLDHSLQTPYLAARAGSSESLIVASLVHDIGHLLHGLSEDIATQGIDGRHEITGDTWLRARFGPAVTEPVRLHVDAKRYLCGVDPDYLGRLSPSSIRSLELQGAPYGESEVREFESNGCFREAVALRRWDDMAKIPDLELPGLKTFRELLERES
jgi:[1-hydroxy-2-(trimethylamino)ethyl]phosphonate dioxygenase